MNGSLLFFPAAYPILDLRAGETVEARLVELTPALARDRIDKRWWSDDLWRDGRRVTPERLGSYPGRDWSWQHFAGEVRGQEYAKAVALQTADDEIQGAMICRAAEKREVPKDSAGDPSKTTRQVRKIESVLDPGQFAIHVDYLATAPRNARELVSEPRYKYIGEGLLMSALYWSEKAFRGGRVNLCSLDGAMDFYRKYGFEDTKIPHHVLGQDGFTIFEIKAAVARRLLAERFPTEFRPPIDE